MITPYRLRMITGQFFVFVSIAATLLGVGLLALILENICVNGFSALHLSLLVLSTPAPGSDGGFLNAMIGSGLITGLAIGVAIPMGLLAGVYLAEYGRYTRVSKLICFINDILLSAPSICIGMFVYQIMVKPMHHFSGYAGSIALALIAIPVILRTTEDMLRLVPDQAREAAAALGAPRWHVICMICFQFAKNGIVTGILLALARIAGETAPLMFTALNNQFLSWDMNAPMANMPTTLFQFAMAPYADWHEMAWAGAFLMTMAVLTANILARMCLRSRKFKS